MHKIVITSFFAILLFSQTFAQSNSSSPYSRFGIGIIEPFTFGRGEGMGGTGTALSSPFEINTKNPASYSVFKYPENSVFELMYQGVKKPNGRPFVFQVGTRGIRTDMFEGELSTSKYNTNLVSLSGKFQLQNYWAMSFGLQPVSSIGYKVSTTDTVTSDDYSSILKTNYSGEGGLNSLFWGNSFYYKGLSIGVNASYVFGPIAYTRTTVLQDGDYAAISNDLRRINVSDFAIRTGIQYTNDTIFGNFGFTLGGYFSNKTELNALQTRFFTRSVLQGGRALTDTLLNDTLSSSPVNMPSEVGVGLTLHSKKLTFTADYTISDFSDVLIAGVQTEQLTKSGRFSAGLEYVPDARSKSFLKTVNYRLGAHTEKTAYLFEGNQLNDIGISLGFGIPVTKSLTFINLALEAGKFGTPTEHQIYENYYKVHLYFNTGAIWFQKRKFN